MFDTKGWVWAPFLLTHLWKCIASEFCISNIVNDYGGFITAKYLWLLVAALERRKENLAGTLWMYNM